MTEAFTPRTVEGLRGATGERARSLLEPGRATGALDLLRRVEAAPDRAIHVIGQRLGQLTGSPDWADEVLDHIEHARLGEPFSRQVRRS